MKKVLFPIVSISLVVLMFGGVTTFISLCTNLFEVIKCFFPTFFEIEKIVLKDYLTSPYFITSVVMAIGSAFGIWFGKDKGKTLFLLISLLSEIISIVSIFMNLFNGNNY